MAGFRRENPDYVALEIKFSNHFSKKLRKLMKGRTKKGVAREVGTLTDTQINNLVKNQSIPSLPTLLDLAKYFDIPASEFFP